MLICLGIALLFLFIFVVFRCLSVGDPYEYQLEVGRGYYVLTPSGKLITWGDNENTAYSNSICWTPFFLRRTVLTDVVRVSSGSWATFAIDSSGNLWGQGSPVFGHLVSQYSEINDRWVLIMKDIAAVASGPQHAAAVTTDGELWTWGGE